ncbi:Rrn6p PWA37_000610 [Arxiozyma heterogenica]|uniref:Rrn6p n=1 Tax=Arxiozyma heterogenica TaxID=278026 RepID=UPI002F160AC2
MNIPGIPSRQSIGHQLTSGVHGPGLLQIDQTDNKLAKWVQPQFNSSLYKHFKFRLRKVSEDFTKLFTKSNNEPLKNKKYYISELRESDFENESDVENDGIDDFLDADTIIERNTLLNDQGSLKNSENSNNNSDNIQTQQQSNLENTGDKSFQMINWKSLIPPMENARPKIFKDIRFTKYNSNLSNNISSTMLNKRLDIDKPRNDYIPSNIIKELDETYEIKEIDSIKNKANRFKVFDLSDGDLIASNMVRTKFIEYDAQKNIIVYITGKSFSKVVFAVLSESDSNDKFSFKIDSRFPRKVFNIDTKVKCIKFASISHEKFTMKDYVAILTENMLTVIKIDNVQLSRKIGKFDCSLWLTLPLSSFSDFPFADISFNPWKDGQCALIDIKGNWFIYDIPVVQSDRLRCNLSGDMNIIPKYKGTIFDPTDLLSFKRIVWSSVESRLLLVTSSKIVEIDIKEKWEREIIEAVSWSEIREFKNMAFNLSILLTSKEVIIVDKNYNDSVVRRVISWKHDLNPDDKTYKFSLHYIKFNDATFIFVAIYSKIENIIYGHSFLYQGKNIWSIGEDTIVNIPEIFKGIKTICDTHQTFNGNFSIGNLKINLILRGVDSQTIYKYLLDVKGTDNIGDIGDFYRSKNNSELYGKLLKPYKKVSEVTLSLLNSITYEPPEGYDKSKDDEVLEKYGYSLSKSLNKLLKSMAFGNYSELLTSIDKPLGYFENLTEYASLLDQFIHHYKDQRISFNDLSILFTVLLAEPIHDIDIFHSKILQCWEPVTSSAEHLTREIVKSLVTGFVRYLKLDVYDEMYQNLEESLDEDHKSIFNSWGDENDDYMDDMAKMSTGFMSSQSHIFTKDSQPMIPVVSFSQKKKSKRSGASIWKVSKTTNISGLSHNREHSSTSFNSSQVSSSLPNNMTPAFSLTQQPPILSQGFITPNASQETYSQKQKKRKKKVGGFN